MRLLLALALMIALSAPARAEKVIPSGPVSAPWAHLQNPSNSCGDGVTSCAVTTTALGGSHLVVVAVSWASVAGTISTVADASNSYTLITGTNITGTVNDHISLYFNANVTAGPTSITVTMSQGVNGLSVIVDEYSGNATASALDPAGGGTGQEQVNPGTGTDAVTSGTITPLVSGDLIYAATSQATPVPGTLVAGTGFTERGSAAGSAGAANGFKTEDLVQSSAAGIAGTFTQSVAVSKWVTAVAGFKHS